MKRLDIYLVEKALAPSRTKAQELIESGSIEVLVNGHFQVIQKPSFRVEECQVSSPVNDHKNHCENSQANLHENYLASHYENHQAGRRRSHHINHVRIVKQNLLKYVARSGLKLEHAIKTLGISPKGKKVLDVGLSTGGFAHCLLEHGALGVVGVDVGTNQLHPQLRNHPNLVFFEGVNARYLRTELNPSYKNHFSLVTVDISFISLEHVLPEIPYFLNPEGEFLLLVKPQFEQGRAPRISFKDIKDKVTGQGRFLGMYVEAYIESQPLGRDGNQEFFAYGHLKNIALQQTRAK